ncbi:MAG: MXAN_5187 C-terminal domain-containing protein [Acidobacteriota bacterium]
MGFHEDMERLKRRMKQLEIEYEQWFSGALPKPPWGTKRVVEDLVRKYSIQPPRTVMEQSIFQMHQAKFNSYTEMWNRKTRLKEEGRLASGQEGRVRPALQPSPGEPAGREGGEDRFWPLFERYIAAKEKVGESTRDVTFDSFRKALAKKSEMLRSRDGYKDVDFGVSVKNGKVSVVARPKK